MMIWEQAMHTHVWEYGYAEFASVALRWLFPH